MRLNNPSEDMQLTAACAVILCYYNLCDDIQDKGIKNKMISELRGEVSKFSTPEHVNNSEQTAPSKRIKRIFGAYQKTTDGMNVANAVGIETMIKRCPHFADWIRKLEE